VLVGTTMMLHSFSRGSGSLKAVW